MKLQNGTSATRVAILELTGPSGSGKSTVYRHLAADSEGYLAPIVRFLPGMVLKSRVYWLGAPLVLLLFRELFVAMYLDNKRDSLGTGVPNWHRFSSAW